jgi:hypothetical protein
VTGLDKVTRRYRIASIKDASSLAASTAILNIPGRQRASSPALPVKEIANQDQDIDRDERYDGDKECLGGGHRGASLNL